MIKPVIKIVDGTLEEYYTISATIPEGYAIVPIEPTDAMIKAYLLKNKAYWIRVDEMPTKQRNPSKWRNGTPEEATKESYKAMIAAYKE